MQEQANFFSANFIMVMCVYLEYPEKLRPYPFHALAIQFLVAHG